MRVAHTRLAAVLMLAGCAEAPGQVEQVDVIAQCPMILVVAQGDPQRIQDILKQLGDSPEGEDRRSYQAAQRCVSVHTSGSGAGGTATASPPINVTAPLEAP